MKRSFCNTMTWISVGGLGWKGTKLTVSVVQSHFITSAYPSGSVDRLCERDGVLEVVF